jgi:hypothetical protein
VTQKQFDFEISHFPAIAGQTGSKCQSEYPYFWRTKFNNNSHFTAPCNCHAAKGLRFLVALGMTAHFVEVVKGKKAGFARLFSLHPFLQQALSFRTCLAFRQAK